MRRGCRLMRSLWLAYPEDAKASAVEDAYLWGDSMLVAPVIEPGATHRTTYLPRGVWWDYWSNARVDGGSEVTREVNLETIPLYVKAGAIVPIGPVKQYTGEVSSEPMVLRVYPGADGAMTLYEDDGVSFDYQKGAFTRIVCNWSDSSRTLSLKADPKGRIPKGESICSGDCGDCGEQASNYVGCKRFGQSVISKQFFAFVFTRSTAYLCCAFVCTRLAIFCDSWSDFEGLPLLSYASMRRAAALRLRGSSSMALSRCCSPRASWPAAR